MKTMIAIRLPTEIDDRLEALVRRTGRSKTYYAREAILRHLEDMEDTYVAIDRLENPGRRWTMDEIEQNSDLVKSIKRTTTAKKRKK